MNSSDAKKEGPDRSAATRAATAAAPSAAERGPKSQALTGATSRFASSLGQCVSRSLDGETLAWATLAFTVLLTLGLWRHAETEQAHRQEIRFLNAAEKQKDNLVNRMHAYKQVLRGGAALMAANGIPTREAWRTYVRTLELDRSLPGILGTGFAEMVPRQAKAAHEAAIRESGFPDYRIHPAGDREFFSSIIYLEPFTGLNLRAFGYDMYSNPKRRDAMERARDTGRPALSQRVTLVQEAGANVQPGFLVYFPVYRNGMPHDTVAQRRDALIGFVYSPFRAYDLLQEVFENAAPDVEIELFDGETTPENRLFATSGADRVARHMIDTPLVVGGHVWVARIRSSAPFEAITASSQPKLILFGGLALDVLLFWVLYMNARHRRKLHAAAEKLEQSLESYRTLVENLPGAAFRAEGGSASPMLQLSHGVEALTGEPPERFLSGALSYGHLIHPEDKHKVDAAINDAIVNGGTYNIEYRIRSTDGFPRWVNERGLVSASRGGLKRWRDGLILDITERKAAEIMIRDLAFYDPLTGLPNRRLLLDRLDQHLASSGRSGGYGALLFIDMDDFKRINDTLGHEAGDLVLVEVATRLLASVRESDTVARFGGDEFVVILDNLGNTARLAAEAAAELGGKILAALGRPYQLGEQVRTSTPSIGVATFSGHRVSADQLLRRADQAMYKAKSAGRNQLRFHGQPSLGVANSDKPRGSLRIVSSGD